MDYIPNYLTPPPGGYVSNRAETETWRRRAGTPTSRVMGGPSRDRRSLGVVGLVLAVVAFATVGVSAADQHPLGLGPTDDTPQQVQLRQFGVLAGAGVTNTGPTTVDGDLGTCPTPAITGAPVVTGETHAADAVCRQAQADLTIAYNDAAGRVPTTTYPGPTDLGGGQTLTAGVYNSPTSFGITGTLILDAENDPDAVFIFQAGSTLITAPNSTVMLTNGAQACNVFWQVGSSATLGVGSTFVGTILALTDITANTNARIEGRLLARNGAVTLDSNVITVPECAPDTTTTTLPDTTRTWTAKSKTTKWWSSPISSTQSSSSPHTPSMPVSSASSRTTASARVSPASTLPPGTDHRPWAGPRPRRTSSSRSSSTATAPTQTCGRGGFMSG